MERPTEDRAAAPGPAPRALALRTGAVWVVAAGFLASLQFRTPFIIGYDGYYHAKYALLLRTLGLFREFKWAAHSLWADHFADKELLYHVYLIPFTWFDSPATGIKVATVLLGATALASFYLILHLDRLRYPLVWLVLLCSSGWVFLYRLDAARPQVLSILLLLWSVHLIVNARRRALAAVVFVYSLSYTGFVLPVVLAAIVAAHLWLTERRSDWRTPLTALGGALVGMVVNPYFPDNLRMFWVQNFYVPWMSLGGEVDLAMAGEFEPLDTRTLVIEHLAVLLPLAGAAYLAVVRPRPLDRKATSLFVVACSLIGMTLLISRFVEYSVPVTLMFLAAFYTRRLDGVGLRRALARGGRERRLAVATAATVVVALAALFAHSYRGALPHFRVPESMLAESALWLRDHADEDELVFTCDWDDTPALFFYNHRNRYPVFLDPNFMYAWDPELWRDWYGAAHGEFGGRTWDVLAPRYRYGVCTWDFERLKWIVEHDPRMEVVLDTGGSWVFRIDRDRPEIPLELFLRLNDGPREHETSD